MNQQIHLETCSDCFVQLPKLEDDSPTHRYMGGSASCWNLFANMHNGGEPPIAPAPLNHFFIDAYCVQHHGVPNLQAIQSVAVHGLPLYCLFELGMSLSPEKAIWMRQWATFDKDGQKHRRYSWLTPPDQSGCLTIGDIAQQPTPETRAEQLQAYITQVWDVWRVDHLDMFARWYQEFIVQ